MPVQAQLRAMMLDTIIVERRTGMNAYTEPIFGPPAPYQCRVEGAARRIMSTDGTVKISTTTIYLADDFQISPLDRVTLPDGTMPPILKTDSMEDEKGPYCQVVYT